MDNLLIRNGSVIDGTGAPAYKADVRVRNGAIVEIGANLQPGSGEKIHDASGCYVSPGFIESHTHYDAVMWWQNDLDPLPGYGATTIIMGNCGFTAAPVSTDAAARAEMIKIFSFFEDIPIDPFNTELPWDWKTWSEYKRSMIDKVKVPTNYASFVGHIAIRLAAMGMAAWDRAATPQEIGRMAELLDDALRAGALGLSSNLLDHDGSDRPIPTLQADDAEFSALIDVLERYPGTSLQVVLDTFMRMTAPAGLDRIAKLCEGKNIRVQWAGLPTLQFQKDFGMQAPMLELHERFAAEGRDFWTGYAHIPFTTTLGVGHSLMWAQSNTYVWHEVILAETDEAKIALMRDPDWRARARVSMDNDVYKFSPMSDGNRLLLLNSDNGAGPINCTVAEYAETLGLHYSDAMAEWFIRNGLKSTIHLAAWPMDEEMVVRLIRDPYSVGNISDAGAHGQMLCGGGENVVLFTKYVKQLKLISVEEAVHVMTGKLAKHFSLGDRGELKVGKRADITVFNLDEVEYRDMKKVYDVPDDKGGKTWRWTRDAAPVRLTLVNGVATFEHGKFTGALPGQMIGPVSR
jgi:N-acyl-D-amino-acid deacylase